MFWRLKKLVVPVVLKRHGLSPFSLRSLVVPFAPTDSVDDFKSPQALAEHLMTVAANQTRYLEYLNWTKTFSRLDSQVPEMGREGDLERRAPGASMPDVRDGTSLPRAALLRQFLRNVLGARLRGGFRCPSPGRRHLGRPSGDLQTSSFTSHQSAFSE